MKRILAVSAGLFLSAGAGAQQIDPSQIRAGNLVMKSYDGYEVHMQRYPGATLEAQVASAQAAWANATGPIKYVLDTPATATQGWTFLKDGSSFEIRADLHMTNAQIALAQNSRVSCAPGVNIYGDGDAGGAAFIVDHGKDYDLDLTGCIVHDIRYVVAIQPDLGVAAPQYVKVHGAETYNISIVDVLVGPGVGGRQDIADDPSQPRHIKVYDMHPHDQTGGLVTAFAAHDLEAYGNSCVNMVSPTTLNYCMFAGANIYDVGGFAEPTGASSEINFHDNYINGAGAAEFVTGSTNVHIGRGSYATGIQDVGFDVEGSTNWDIGDATCGSAGNGCATSFFVAHHWRIHNITAPTAAILIKNSNNTGFPERVSDGEISGSTVATIIAESGENLRVLGNNAGSYSIGPNANLVLSGNNCVARPTSAATTNCYSINSTYYGSPATLFNNTARLDLSAMPTGVTPSPLSAMFSIISQYTNAPSDYNLDSNRNVSSSFPSFMSAITNPQNAVHTTFHLVNNRRGNSTITSRVDSGSASVLETSYWDANEVLHMDVPYLRSMGLPVLTLDTPTGTCAASSLTYSTVKVQNNDGTTTSLKVLTCP